MTPRNIRVVNYNIDYVTIAWDQPDDEAPVQRYIIERKDDVTRLWTQVASVDEHIRSLKADKLYEGQGYFFRVAAENLAGRGSWVETGSAVVPRLPFGKTKNT